MCYKHYHKQKTLTFYIGPIKRTYCITAATSSSEPPAGWTGPIFCYLQ